MAFVSGLGTVKTVIHAAGVSPHMTTGEKIFEINAAGNDISYTSGRDSALITAENRFSEYARGGFEQLSRADGFANYDSATAAPADSLYSMNADVRNTVKRACTVFTIPSVMMTAPA